MENLRQYSYTIKTLSFGDETEYMVSFELFPDVIGVGSTQEEAIEEGYSNLEDYIIYCQENNISIPQPQQTKWLDDYSGKITIRITKSLHRDLSNYAEQDGMSINSIVSDALRLYLSQKSLQKILEETSWELDDTFCEARNIYRYDENTNQHSNVGLAPTVNLALSGGR